MAAKMVANTGDFVDACDMQGRWLAAEVIGVSSSCDVRVHFLGHVCNDDETISMRHVAGRIVPLYTHTPDRRNWEVNDIVDYKCSVEYEVWISVSIAAIDSAKGTVQLSLNQKQLEEALRTRGAPISAAKNAKVVWVHVCSDHVAPLGTHTNNSSGNKNKRVRRDIIGNYYQHVVSALAAQPPSSPQTWLAPLLRAHHVSEAHIVHCEQALVQDEGFTTSALFAAVPVTELTVYLRELGITARGVLLNLVEVHKALQVGACGEGEQAKSAIELA